MQIIVNTEKLKLTASNLESIISDLSEKRNNLIRLQSNLDYSIRYARNINQTIFNLSSRLYEAQCDLNRIKTFLNTTANKYEEAEETVNHALNRMCELMGCSVNQSNSNFTGATQGNSASKPKWYQQEWVKWIGGVALGAGAVALCFAAPIGLTIGAAIIGGGVINGSVNAYNAHQNGEDKSNAFINGFISGGIGTAVGTAVAIIGGPSFAAGAATSFTTQLVGNILEDKSILEGAVGATLWGGLFGFGFDKFGKLVNSSNFSIIPQKTLNFATKKFGKVGAGAIKGAENYIKKQATKGANWVNILDSMTNKITNSKAAISVGNYAKSHMSEKLFKKISPMLSYNTNAHISDDIFIGCLSLPVISAKKTMFKDIGKGIGKLAYNVYEPKFSTYINENENISQNTKDTYNYYESKVSGLINGMT